MRFALFGMSDDDRLRWFSMAGTDFAVQVALPDLDDLARLQGRCALATSMPDVAQYRRELARKWFVGFRGAEDPSGNPIENTQANREMLLKDATVLKLVSDALADFAAWRTEGNAGSGSA